MRSMLAPTDIRRLLIWLERDFFCAMSLGRVCHSAMALKEAGIRKFASPFDWIFSSPEAISHCLSDDFETFLNKSMYLDIPEEQRESIANDVCDHVYYRDNFGIKSMFNHHSPIGSEFYAYLQRCVQRFRLTMACDKPKLLLMITSVLAPPESYQQLLRQLSAYQGEFLLLVIRVVPDLSKAGRFRLVDMELGLNFIAMDIYTADKSNGVHFINPEDNATLDKLLRRFKVNLELPEELRTYISNRR